MFELIIHPRCSLPLSTVGGAGTLSACSHSFFFLSSTRFRVNKSLIDCTNVSTLRSKQIPFLPFFHCGSCIKIHEVTELALLKLFWFLIAHLMPIRISITLENLLNYLKFFKSGKKRLFFAGGDICEWCMSSRRSSSWINFRKTSFVSFWLPHFVK